MLSFLFYYVNLPKVELLVNLCVSTLIDWGRVVHICIGNLTIIGSDNCLRLVGAMPLSEPMLKYC